MKLEGEREKLRQGKERKTQKGLPGNWVEGCGTWKGSNRFVIVRGKFWKGKRGREDTACR